MLAHRTGNPVVEQILRKMSKVGEVEEQYYLTIKQLQSIFRPNLICSSLFTIMFQEIWSFLLNPSSLRDNKVKESTRHKFQKLFKVYLFCMASLVVSAVLIGIVDVILGEFLHYSIAKRIQTNQLEFRTYWAESAWLITVLLGPVSEEIVFRLPLSTNKKWFALAISFGVFYFLGDDIIDYKSFSLTRIAISILTFLSLYIFLTEKLFNWLITNGFNLFCWGLIILFSWTHIRNFEPINWSIIYLYPIYVLPQLFYGIGASFLMIKYKNLLWPLMLHVLNNGVAALLRSIH